jgi:hypothetical protein
MMATVELTDQEWQQVINMIAAQPWSQANPLLMKIGGQLNAQHPVPPRPSAEELKRMGGVQIDANGKEVRHGE